MTPSQPIQTQQAAPDVAQPQQPASDNSSNLPDDENAVAGEGQNLQRAYSRLNESVRALYDGLGIRRSATIPHQNGQSMSDHISDVGQVMADKGGISGNILTATHTQHDADGGSTVSHPNAQLQTAIIPKDSVESKAAIASCKSFVSKCESLVGETPEILKAKSQISLVGKSSGEGMTAFDLGVALLNIPGPVIQVLARLHSTQKHGEHHAALTAPKVQQQS
jgi:hypothetical protein